MQRGTLNEMANAYNTAPEHIPKRPIGVAPGFNIRKNLVTSIAEFVKRPEIHLVWLGWGDVKIIRNIIMLQS